MTMPMDDESKVVVDSHVQNVQTMSIQDLNMLILKLEEVRSVIVK